MTDNVKLQMQELSERIREASKAYYAEDKEIMSNYEYDALYDKLVQLEKESGIVLSTSPTQTVGYEAVDELPKERHESPMLSLDKTKDSEVLKEWIGDQKTLMSWKLDGLTIVLTYENGSLMKAVTRGNGEVGEVITNNARVFKNIPLTIPFTGELILRGEAVIGYKDFEKINQEIEDVDAKYKNPRNLCSGSVRQLSNAITAKRNVKFYAFALVRAQDVDFHNSHEKQFIWLKEQGFEVVEYKVVTGDTMDETMKEFADNIQKNDFPSDGLVVLYDDISYGLSLGRTSKYPRDAMAFKWADEIRETKLTMIEWSPSRTGLINPVAVFEPIELEGTTVSRASVHNISIMEELELGVGDTIQVYKANMIIPQIAENLTRSGLKDIPATCPVCGGKTQIRQDADTKTLVCTNPDCQAKKIKAYTLFVSRDAMNIDGLSEMTLEKLIDMGFIHEFADIFRLSAYEEQIVNMEGFGKRSYKKLQESVDAARNTTLPRLLYAIGIPNIGVSNGKVLAKYCNYDLEKLMESSAMELSGIEGIGDTMAESVVTYFKGEEHRRLLRELLKEITLESPKANEGGNVLEGKIFVITGSVNHFANRNELKALIESKGGKATGSVSSNTSYLINNDTTSGSSKNKKAKELNIPIISEDDFLKMIGEEE